MNPYEFDYLQEAIRVVKDIEDAESPLDDIPALLWGILNAVLAVATTNAP